MVERAETHALESTLFDPVTQATGRIGLKRVEQPVRHKTLWIFVKRKVYVGVVPAVVTRIDQHRVLQAELVHFRDLVFNRRFDRNTLQLRMLGMMEWKFRVEGPYFEMCVDDQA